MLVKEQNIADVWARHKNLSQAIWAAFDCWSLPGHIQMNVRDKQLRSHAVTAASIKNGGAKKLQDWCERNSDLTLGIGLGMAEQEDPKIHDFFRIGHMGHINATMILGVLSTIDVALKALDIPHGQNAMDSATRTLAKTYKI
jgi:alanine-glyoxylate transaminase/serine-glyoxylate transaminase/serine-pyruvate transaminase